MFPAVLDAVLVRGGSRGEGGRKRSLPFFFPGSETVNLLKCSDFRFSLRLEPLTSIFAVLVHRAVQPDDAVEVYRTLLIQSACPSQPLVAPPPQNGRAEGVATLWLMYHGQVFAKGKMLDPS